ncbi:hypothetical protein Aduo_004665 [Ancylostoma duodenale]
MALYLYKKAITTSSSNLADVLKKYEGYGEKVDYPEDDNQRHKKCSNNLVLLTTCLGQIRLHIDNLESKIERMEEFYMSVKSKTEQKDMIAEIEELERESQYSKIMKDATSFAFTIESQIADTKINLQKVQAKLKLPIQHSFQRENSHDTEVGESSTTSNEVTETSSSTSKKPRTVKPPSITLPKFHGNQEEFPEFWAIFESLIHENDELSTIEKIVLLKESLKGSAEKAIRGIKPVPSNYNWMVETITKRFGNKPMNRSKIVQKLFELKSAGNRAGSCQEYFDSIKTLVNQMVSAGYDIRDTCDPMWTETILKKFPHEIVKDILVKNQETETMKVDDLLETLEREITAKAYIELRLGPSQQNSYKTDNRYNQASTCIFCGRSNHQSLMCRTVIDKMKRRELLKQNKACWKCFQTTHSSSSCKKANCSNCGRTHHVSVCLTSDGTRPNHPAANPPASTARWSRNETNQNGFNNRLAARGPQPTNRYANPSNDIRRQHTGANQPLISNQNIENGMCDRPSYRQNEQLVLMTAEGNVWNHKTHKFEKALFFFDTGAQKTVIEEALADKLGLPRITSETCVMSGIGGHTERFESHVVSLKIGTAYGNEFDITILTKPIITGGFPSVRLTETDRAFLQCSEICVANSKIRGERQIPHILVGLDRYFDLVISNTTGTQTPSGLHVAKTVFGPTIYGRGQVDNDDTLTVLTHSMTSVCECSDSENIQRLFELEGMGITSAESNRDEGTYRYFQEYSKTITFNDNCITAPFPLKDNISDLSDNYGVAIKRLAALQRKLLSNDKQMEWYRKILDDYEDHGVIERVYEPEENAVGNYYMPHSGVWREEKQKPLRIVFDASSKKKGELSLNDVIHKGESFVNKIHDILIASRASKYILLCDIEAAFTQIRLKAAHKDLCRFLWLEDPTLPPISSNIVEYRFTRIPFGVTASPSILNMAILAYIDSVGSKFAGEIARNIYVDNILLLANSEEEAVEKYKLSKKLFSKIGMNLREYVSNSEFVNKNIPVEDRQTGGRIRMLGLNYDTVNDRFSVSARFPREQNLTKREIVSQINSLYDPLGKAGPLVVKLKDIMRESFATQCGWSDRLPTSFMKKWNEQCDKIDGALIEVPRLIIPMCNMDENLCLWLFADASKTAMATCAYLQDRNTKAMSQLVSGKTRLSPKNYQQTIPRLELLAILLAMRLGSSILQAVNKGIKEISIGEKAK